MNQISYRRAEQPDVPILTEYRIRFALELSGPQAEEKVIQLRRQLSDYFNHTMNKDCISVIAECEGEVAGIGSVMLRQTPGNFRNPSGKWGYIMNMYTNPAFRRHGVCRNILNLLVKLANEQGATAMELHATKEGEMVYTKEDFVLHSEPTYRKFLAADSILQ